MCAEAEYACKLRHFNLLAAPIGQEILTAASTELRRTTEQEIDECPPGEAIEKQHFARKRAVLNRCNS
jgi:hypothetical protein